MISEGRSPLKRLDLRLRILRAPNLPRVLDGIRPKNPTPGSLRASTLELSCVQVMPTQDVHIGLVEFQFRFRRWGTAA